MRLYCVEKLLQKRLWTCHKTDYSMNDAWYTINCRMLKHVLEVTPYSSEACLVCSEYTIKKLLEFYLGSADAAGQIITVRVPSVCVLFL